MNFTLFDHQEEFLGVIRPNLGKYKKVIACAPTGSGKTKMFIAISYAAEGKGKAVLIITESRPIFSQIIKERNAKLISAGVKYMHVERGKVYIAMAQTLKNRPGMIEDFAALGGDLIVINDEAHVGHANGIIDKLRDCLLIGFTASPDARAAKHIPKLYKYICVSDKMTPEWLVNNKYLASYRHIARVAAHVDELEMQGGEYTEESQEKVFETRVVYEGLESDLRITPFKKCLIFCASIRDAEHTYDTLRSMGFNCCCYHSQSEPGQLERFIGTTADVDGETIWTDGDCNICVSVGILTKGFDFQPIDLIVLKRKTNSLPLYLQMMGRGSRLFPALDPDKTSFTCLDYGENFKQHEYWITHRDWQDLAKQKKKKERDGVPPSKMCPECDSIIPVSTRQCPYCGYIYPDKEEEAPPESKLFDLTKDYQSIKGRMISTLNPRELATYAKTTGNKNWARVVAKHLDELEHGYLGQYATHMGYKPSWRHVVRQGSYAMFKDFMIR